MQVAWYDRRMLGKTYDGEVCSIARSLEVVGERWSLLIIRDALFAGSTRYGDFQRTLGIATNVLQDRLDGFVVAGIMRRKRTLSGVFPSLRRVRALPVRAVSGCGYSCRCPDWCY